MYVSEPSFAGISPSLQAMASVPANEQQMSAERARPAAVVSGDGDRLSLAGALDITTLADARKSLKKLSRRGAAGSLNIAKLDTLDTPGALFLCGLRDKGVKLTGVRAEHRALLDLICGLDLKPAPKKELPARWRQFAVRLGKASHDARHGALDLIDFVGRAASWTLGALLHPSRLRPAARSIQSRELEGNGCRELGGPGGPLRSRPPEWMPKRADLRLHCNPGKLRPTPRNLRLRGSS